MFRLHDEDKHPQSPDFLQMRETQLLEIYFYFLAGLKRSERLIKVLTMELGSIKNSRKSGLRFPSLEGLGPS